MEAFRGRRGLKFNPQSEVRYRVELASRYLKEAKEAAQRRDHRSAVASSQLCAENAAKAVIALYRIPSWSHDLSHELLEVIQNLRPEWRRILSRSRRGATLDIRLRNMYNDSCTGA